jgi:uncharacterized surface protein with fasciclin (FAS1) repeats
MHIYKKLFVAIAATAAISGGVPLAVAGGAAYNTSATAAPMAQADIVDTALAAGQFKTLAKALTEAGLIETLKGPGPYTVFAPTDAAFAKIPADQLNALLADKEMLVKVLTYHVVPGTVMAKDVKSGAVKTVEGEALMIDVSNMGVKVNDAKVIKTDIVATNGVIHVIDTVVVPN